MRSNKLFLILALFMVLMCFFSVVSASEDVDDSTITFSGDAAVNEVVSVVDLGDKSIAIENDESLGSVDDSTNESLAVQDTGLSEDNSILSEGSDEIEVGTWEDIRYYSSLTDKNYILKLKENTNYYPNDVQHHSTIAYQPLHFVYIQNNLYTL